MKTGGIVLERATAADVPAIAALLGAAELPHEDVDPAARHFLVAREDGVVVGAVGAEVHGSDALLRSLVVAPEHRGGGLGAALLRRLNAEAGAWGVRRWWLLTTSARAYFEARGFRVTPRADAPAAIQATRQFRGGCCATALCLSRAREEAA
jgi:amino-acid N-acetyltransferase